MLGQIPVVMSICEGGDGGAPVALGDTMTAQAFIHVAHELIDAVEERNANKAPTQVVNVKH